MAAYEVKFATSAAKEFRSLSPQLKRRVGEAIDALGRNYVLGRADKGRRLFVVFTPRQDKLRVISAREMTKRERAFYPL